MLFLLVAFSLSSYQIKDLKVHLVIKKLIEKDSINYKRLTILEDEFNPSYKLYSLLSGNIIKKSVICPNYKWISNRSLSDDQIISTSSIFHLRKVYSTADHLHYPPLIEHNCLDSNGSFTIDFQSIDSTPWVNSYISSSKIPKNILFEINYEKTEEQNGDRTFDAKHVQSFKDSFDEFIANSKSNIKHYILGFPAMQFYGLQGIKYTSILNIIFTLFLLIVCRIFLGTLRSGVLFSITLSLMAGFIYGGMALFKIPIDILNSGIFLILAISALEDFIFLSAAKLKNNIDAESLFKKLIVPSFFTSLTTVIGFGSLYFSDILIIKRLGLIAAVGSLIEWILLFFFLPAFIKVVPYFANWTDSSKSYFSGLLSKSINLRFPAKLLLPVMSVFVIGSYTLVNPLVNEAAFDIYPDSHSFKQGMDILKSDRGWSASFHLVFKDFDNKKVNLDILNQLKKHKEVVLIQDPYTIEDYLTKDLSSTRSQLVMREYKTTRQYKKFVSNSNMARAIVFIKKNELKPIRSITKLVNKLCKDGNYCFATGNIISYAEFGEKTSSTLIRSFGVSIILVSLIIVLLALFKNITHWKSLVISATWGPFAILGLMTLFQIPINFLTCMFASIIVGLTGDNAIQYIFASESSKLSEGIEKRAAGSILMFLIMSLSALIFQFSYFKFSKEFGLILICGLFLSLIGDLWILKGLIKKK